MLSMANIRGQESWMNEQIVRLADSIRRRSFVGGSDARIIMGRNEAMLLRLWREKRGEADAEDLSGNLVVQLGAATEELNRWWYERNTGRRVTDIQRKVKHSAIPWMAATLDGIVEGMGAVP
jgi:predicted phage-related endonuclease